MLLPRIVTSLLLLALLPAFGQAAGSAGYDRLMTRHTALAPQLADNPFGVPIVIESNGDNGRMQGNVYGVLDEPYSVAKQALGHAENWCDITPLHFNVKVCTWQQLNGDYRLTLYSGRKFYEEPDSTYIFSYRFHDGCQGDDFCEVSLTAEDGPMDTGNYLIRVELAPLDGKTFVHFHYSYDYGFLTRMAMAGYFATLGAGKFGFTVVGKDDQGNPEYTTGVEGVMERNAMRYFLALQTYLETLDISDDQRFEARLQRWYDLTDQYRKQLYEMSREDYLAFKRHEYLDQQKMQKVVNR